MKIPLGILVTRGGAIPPKSLVDFVGLLEGGRFIAFDAKETKSKTSFPLKNIHQHQYEYLKMVDELGGIAFFMIHFTQIHEDKAFITPISLVKTYWEGNTRKSIPLKDLDDKWLVDINNYLQDIENNEAFTIQD